MPAKLRRLLLSRFLLPLFASAALVCTAPGQPVATGVIEGRVSNTAAGQFLTQVRIVVENSVFETLTNEAGEFRLTGVPAGAVTLRATAAGLDAQTMRLTVAAGQTTQNRVDKLQGRVDANAERVSTASAAVETGRIRCATWPARPRPVTPVTRPQKRGPAAGVDGAVAQRHVAQSRGGA